MLRKVSLVFALAGALALPSATLAAPGDHRGGDIGRGGDMVGGDRVAAATSVEPAIRDEAAAGTLVAAAAASWRPCGPWPTLGSWRTRALLERSLVSLWRRFLLESGPRRLGLDLLAAP